MAERISRVIPDLVNVYIMKLVVPVHAYVCMFSGTVRPPTCALCRPTQQARHGTENLYLDLFTVDLPYGHCFRSSVPLLNDGVRRYL